VFSVTEMSGHRVFVRLHSTGHAASDRNGGRIVEADTLDSDCGSLQSGCWVSVEKTSRLLGRADVVVVDLIIGPLAFVAPDGVSIFVRTLARYSRDGRFWKITHLPTRAVSTHAAVEYVVKVAFVAGFTFIIDQRCFVVLIDHVSEKRQIHFSGGELWV